MLREKSVQEIGVAQLVIGVIVNVLIHVFVEVIEAAS